MAAIAEVSDPSAFIPLYDCQNPDCRNISHNPGTDARECGGCGKRTTSQRCNDCKRRTKKADGLLCAKCEIGELVCIDTEIIEQFNVPTATEPPAPEPVPFRPFHYVVTGVPELDGLAYPVMADERDMVAPVSVLTGDPALDGTACLDCAQELATKFPIRKCDACYGKWEAALKGYSVPGSVYIRPDDAVRADVTFPPPAPPRPAPPVDPAPAPQPIPEPELEPMPVPPIIPPNPLNFYPLNVAMDVKRRITEDGQSVAQVAENMNLHRRRVDLLLSLASADESVCYALKDKQLNLQTAYLISMAPHPVQVRIIEAAAGKRIKSADVEGLVEFYT